MKQELVLRRAQLPQRVLAYALDLALAVTLALMLLTLWVIPRYYSEPFALLQDLQAQGNTLNAQSMMQFTPEQQRSVVQLLGTTQWIMISVIFLYFFFSEHFSHGQSLGKRIFRLCVIPKGNKRQLTSFDYLLRSLISTLCLTTFFPVLLLDFVWAMFRKDRRTWHDLTTNTMVGKY